MKVEKKDIIHGAIITVLLVVCVLSGIRAIRGIKSDKYVQQIENKLEQAENENRGIGEQLRISIDGAAELERLNREAGITAGRIAEHNSRAIQLIASSLSEAQSIDEIIEGIESGIEEIEKAVFLALDQ